MISVRRVAVTLVDLIGEKAPFFAALLSVWPFVKPMFAMQHVSPFLISVHYFPLMLGIGALASLAILPLRAGFIIFAKWAIIGRRETGQYPWDGATYLLRWKLFTAIKTDAVLSPIVGSAYIVAWFRMLGCTIGRNVCLYPQGCVLTAI